MLKTKIKKILEVLKVIEIMVKDLEEKVDCQKHKELNCKKLFIRPCPNYFRNVN